MKFCNRCMERLEEEFVCTRCGYDLREHQDIVHALRPGTVLYGKYVVGNVLGQGGFGITYIGYDLALEVKVAIKEYYVTGIASRIDTVSQEVYWTSDPSNMSHFITEARRMARLEDMPEIAKVRDVFYENKTSYIVMEYVEGEELRYYLQKNGTLSYEQAIKLMLPVIEALGQVHDKGIIHRDISPDNLMMEPKGTLRVLDLGAAGDLNRNNGQASQMVARQGFSPYEQYIETGKIGPWTDVYAVCATILYCCTGKVIPDAYARVDQYMKTRDFRIAMDPLIPVAGGEVLQKGLALDVANRIANMEDLAEQLKKSLKEGNAGSTVREPNSKEKGESGHTKIGKWFLIGVTAMLVAVIGMGVFAWQKYGNAFLHGVAEKKEYIVANTETYEELPVVLEIAKTMDLDDVELGAIETVNVLCGISADEIRWSSSNPQVAKVSKNGTVTVEGSGSSEIVAQYEGQTAICIVTVNLKGNVACTYKEYKDGLAITGFEGELPPNMILPSKIDGKYVTEIGKDAFSGCTELTSVIIPNGVRKIGINAFFGCTALKSIVFPDSLTMIERCAFSDCTALTNMQLPDSVTHIGNEAFYNCTSLTSVTIPKGVRTLGESAFSYCTNLAYVSIPSSVGRIERWTFCGCTKLTEVILPNSVTLINEGAFRYCMSLTNITIPIHIKKLEKSVFRDCVSLTELIIPGQVSVIEESAFSGCTSLTRLTIPENVKIIENSAFLGCTGLADITFPDSKVTIESFAFNDSNKLTSVTLSNDCEIEYRAFPTQCTIKFFR